MSLLENYNIDKKKGTDYKLKFTTLANADATVTYDSATNTNTITLTPSATGKTKFSEDFNSTDGKLQISFIQNSSSSQRSTLPPVTDPVIIISDGSDGGF
jgi:hypothetical protein